MTVPESGSACEANRDQGWEPSSTRRIDALGPGTGLLAADDGVAALLCLGRAATVEVVPFRAAASPVRGFLQQVTGILAIVDADE